MSYDPTFFDSLLWYPKDKLDDSVLQLLADDFKDKYPGDYKIEFDQSDKYFKVILKFDSISAQTEWILIYG